MTRRWPVLLLATVALSCQRLTEPAADTEEAGATQDAGEDDEPWFPQPSPTTGAADPDAATDDEGSSGGSDESGGGFLFRPDYPGTGPWPDECDVFMQDCPPGEKCGPGGIGSGGFDGLICIPVVPDPAGIGEPCTVEVQPYSGLDDCGLGAVCWWVDPDTLEGTCYPLCGGSSTSPGCPGDFECPLGGGWEPICEMFCDPVTPQTLTPQCLPDHACYPDRGTFKCAPDLSGPEGAPGDPCTFTNDCDPHSACLDATAIPDCPADRCCVPYCQTDAADPSAPCEPFDPGTTCTPWYEAGQAPHGLDDVGVCVVPW